MIPLKDNIPTARFPVVTVVLIAINVAFFIWQWQFPTDRALDEVGFSEIDQSALEYGAIPYRITHPGEGGDCSLGAVPSESRNEPTVVCPGTPELAEAEQTGRQNP